MVKWVARKLPWIVLACALAALLVYGFWPSPFEVETTKVTRGTLVVTVDEDGKTRIREKYTVSAPVSGKLLRVELEEGDGISQGETVLCRIEPSDPALLDARARTEADARVRAAEAAWQQAEAALERAKEAAALRT